MSAAVRDARPGEIDGDAFDRYSLMHGGFGALMAVAGMSWLPTLALAVGWEVAERFLKPAFPDLPWHRTGGELTNDRLVNALGDVAITMASWYVVRRFL